MGTQNIEDLITWLREQEESISFGKISISIVRHAGVTREIERAVIIKDRPGK